MFEQSIPVGRPGRPEEVAGFIAYLLGPEARFFCGSMLFIDGGTDALFRTNDWPQLWEPQGCTVLSRRPGGSPARRVPRSRPTEPGTSG